MYKSLCILRFARRRRHTAAAKSPNPFETALFCQGVRLRATVSCTWERPSERISMCCACAVQESAIPASSSLLVSQQPTSHNAHPSGSALLLACHRDCDAQAMRALEGHGSVPKRQLLLGSSSSGEKPKIWSLALVGSVCLFSDCATPQTIECNTCYNRAAHRGHSRK
jgi:hypothetical protein